MTSSGRGHGIEDILGYKFSRQDDLLKALTAAGAIQQDWDGNRRLAQFGTALSGFLLSYLAYEAGATRADATDFKAKVTSNAHRASIARRTGISSYIKFNEKEGARSSSVLAKAVNAIIAVIYFDCGGDIGVVLRTMRHIGIFSLDNQSINPALLCVDGTPQSDEIEFLARSLFPVDTSRPSPSAAASKEKVPLLCSSTPHHVTTEPQRAAAQTVISEKVGNDSQVSPAHLDHSSKDHRTQMDLGGADQAPQDRIQIVQSTLAENGEASSCGSVDIMHQPPRPMEKRGSGHEAESGQRKKLRGCDSLPYSDVIGTYLIEEERKCQAFGHRAPQQTFLTPSIQQAIQNLGKGKTEVLAKILIHIGSPCLIGGLQDILESCKTQKSCTVSEARSPLSRAERFHLIASLGHAMSRSQLLRRYHILQLFKDCGGPGTPICGLVMTPSDMARPSNKRGNPVNRSVADVTSRMMQEIFPTIETTTRGYATNYRWISDIRRLGQRLHVLETRFGEGVLGLMLDQGLPGTDVGITDKMIMSPTDAEYAEFVNILDKSQGDLLRGLSSAVLPAVQSLTVGGLHQWQSFHVKKMTVDDIAKYPKGSPAFLELIREAA